jgi:hypothetical protein
MNKVIHIKLQYVEEINSYLAYYVDNRDLPVHPSSFYGEGDTELEALGNLVDNTCEAKLKAL